MFKLETKRNRLQLRATTKKVGISTAHNYPKTVEENEKKTKGRKDMVGKCKSTVLFTAAWTKETLKAHSPFHSSRRKRQEEQTKQLKKKSHRYQKTNNNKT
jgi:hypothetical protein